MSALKNKPKTNYRVSIRDKALEAVRNFKHSWVRVAQVLTDIGYGCDYREWDLKTLKSIVRKSWTCFKTGKKDDALIPLHEEE